MTSEEKVAAQAAETHRHLLGTISEIVEKGPDSITDEERSFLMARRSYLTEAQRIDFDLTDESPAASSDEAPAPRRGRRAASSDEA